MTKPTGGARSEFHSGRRSARRSESRSDRGAALVEFAILTPLLLLLLLGIIEFGWFMSQNNDVRHGAREAARLAAVDADTSANMATVACDAMPLTSGATVAFSNPGNPPGRAQVQVQANVTTLTGFPGVSTVMPPTIQSTVKVTIEQPSTWGAATVACP